MNLPKQKVIAIDYHRNGISGLPFHVAIVEDRNDGVKREMLVIRFPKKADEDTGNIVCAAFDLDLLDKREIRFFHNSFRGDHFHEVVDTAIRGATDMHITTGATTPMIRYTTWDGRTILQPEGDYEGDPHRDWIHDRYTSPIEFFVKLDEWYGPFKSEQIALAFVEENE